MSLPSQPSPPSAPPPTLPLSLSPPLYPPAHPSRYLAPSYPSSSTSPGSPAALLLRRTSSRSSSQSYLEVSDDEESNAERGRRSTGAESTNTSGDGHASPDSRGMGSGTMMNNLVRWRKNFKRFEKTAKGWFEANAGLCLIAMAQMFFASMNASVKYLNSIGGSLPTLELVLIRMVFTLAGCVSYLFYTGDENPLLGPREVRGLLMLRGFIGFFGLTGMYQSLRHLSLSDATVLGFLAPTATALLGYVVLKEPFSRKESLAGFISLFGVILIARPTALFGSSASSPDPNTLPEDYSMSRVQTSKMVDSEPVEAAQAGERLAAVGFALMGVCGSAGAYICIRAIGKRAKPFHSITYFSFWCVVVSFVGMIVLKQPVELPYGWIGWLSILVIGVFGLAAQVLLTMGLQREKAGRASLAMYTQLLFAGVIERIFFHTVPPLLSLFGTFIILAAALWVAFSKQDSPTASGTGRQQSDTDSSSTGGWNLLRVAGQGTPAVEAGIYMPLTQLPDVDSNDVGNVPPPRTLSNKGLDSSSIVSGVAKAENFGRSVPQRKGSAISLRSTGSGSHIDIEDKR